MLRNDLSLIIAEQQYQKRLVASQDHLVTVIENIQSQLEPEMKDWVPSGGSGTSSFERDIPITDLRGLVTRSRHVYYREPHGRVVMRDLVKFVIGGGTVVDFREKDEDKLKEITDWWRKFCKLNAWVRRQREIVTRAFRDGNVLIRRIDQSMSDQPPLIRFLEPDQLDDNAEHPNGILCDENDAETPVAYFIKWRKKNYIEEIPASEILHIKIDVDENVPLGRPIIESVLNYLGKYNKWIDARMALNMVRASVALVKQVAGSPNDLSRLRSQQNAMQRNRANETDRTKMLRPGTIISGTPGVEYKMLSPNLDARDASEDGATLLRGVAAGAGFPDVFVTANYSGSNYASTVVSQNTGIREFEDWSAFFGEHIGVIVDWVIQDGIQKGVISTDSEVDHDIDFPPLIRRDLGTENAAYQIMNQNGVISKRSWAIRMGFNRDLEMAFIDDEGGPPVPVQPAFPGGKPPAAKPPAKQPEDKQPVANTQL